MDDNAAGGASGEMDEVGGGKAGQTESGLDQSPPVKTTLEASHAARQQDGHAVPSKFQGEAEASADATLDSVRDGIEGIDDLHGPAEGPAAQDVACARGAGAPGEDFSGVHIARVPAVDDRTGSTSGTCPEALCPTNTTDDSYAGARRGCGTPIAIDGTGRCGKPCDASEDDANPIALNGGEGDAALAPRAEPEADGMSADDGACTTTPRVPHEARANDDGASDARPDADEPRAEDGQRAAGAMDSAGTRCDSDDSANLPTAADSAWAPNHGSPDRGRGADGDARLPVRASYVGNRFEVRSLRHFLSSSRIPAILDGYVVAALRENRPLDHILIHGAVGSGTTTLARALILDYTPRRVVEIDALNGCDVETLRRAINRVRGTGLLFIRHVEVLDAACDAYLARMMGRDEIPEEHRLAEARRSTEADRIDPSNARSTGDYDRTRMRPRFTLLATAHFTGRIGYPLRMRFDHMLHLREDPIALARAIGRLVERGGVSIDDAAMPRLGRVAGSLLDSAEQIAKAIEARAELDRITRIDDDLMRSILEQDLADRLPDEAYAYSLRRLVAGLPLDAGLHAEVPRLLEQTGWGEVALRAALAVVLREEPKRAA